MFSSAEAERCQCIPFLGVLRQGRHLCDPLLLVPETNFTFGLLVTSFPLSVGLPWVMTKGSSPSVTRWNREQLLLVIKQVKDNVNTISYYRLSVT
jgi:hypothetical protein